MSIIFDIGPLPIFTFKAIIKMCRAVGLRLIDSLAILLSSREEYIGGIALNVNIGIGL